VAVAGSVYAPLWSEDSNSTYLKKKGGPSFERRETKFQEGGAYEVSIYCGNCVIDSMGIEYGRCPKR
jgi:hypothetical protein